MKYLLVAVAIGGLLLTGCSRSGSIPESQKLRNAPTEASRTGYLVLGAQESDLASLAESNPKAFVRPINKSHGLYEVHGALRSEIRRHIGPHPTIEKNKYRRVMPSKTNVGFSILDYDFQDDFLDDCRDFKADKDAFQIQLEKQIDKFEISYLYQLGDVINIQFLSETEQQFMWKIDAPYSSVQKSNTDISKQLSFTPDVSGEYILSVISKNAEKSCRVQKLSLYVTANPKYDPTTALSDVEKSEFDLEAFWHLEFLGLPGLWEKSTGSDVVIAIIDTGIHYNHESLVENIHMNTNEIPGNSIDDDGNGFVDDHMGYDFASSDEYPYDDNGHGTHVAGLAAASTFGVAKNAKIMALKTLTGLGTDTGSFAGAIYYAVDNGAHIINASFGWREDLPIFRKAMEYARDRGVLVVTASGNGDSRGLGINNDLNPSYPTNYKHPNIISVAAVDEDLELTPYSNFGPKTVDIASFGGAPWLKLFSTSHQEIGGRLYIGKNGTSQASPIVAGAAALLLSQNPELSAVELKLRLLESAEKKVSLTGKLLSSGVLDIASALNGQTRLLSSR